MSVKYVREIESSGLYEFAVADRSGRNIEQLLNDGFLPLEQEEKPEVELGEYQRLKRCYRREEGRVVRYFTIEEDDTTLLESQIDRVKGELAESDYKVVKLFEESIVGAEYSYDAEQLHQEREALRGQIRDLEARLNAK